MKRSAFKQLLREEIIRTLKKDKLEEAKLNEMAQIAGALKTAIENVMTENPDLTGLALKKAIRSDETVKSILSDSGEQLFDNQLNRFIAVAKGEMELQQRGRKPKEGGEKDSSIASDTVNSTDELVKYVQAAKKTGKKIIGSKRNPDGTITVKYRKEAVKEEVEQLDEMAKIAGELKSNIERVIQANPDLTGLALKKAIKADPEIKAYFDEHPEEELYDNQLNKFIGLTKGERTLQTRGRKEAPKENTPKPETKTFNSVGELVKFLKSAEKQGITVISTDFKEDGTVDAKYTQKAEALNESKEEQLVRKLIREELSSIIDEEDELDERYADSPNPEDWEPDSDQDWGDDDFDDDTNYDGVEELDEMAKIAGDLKSAIEKVIKDNPDLDNLPLKKKIKSNPEVTSALGDATIHDNQLNQFISLTKGERVKGQVGKPAGTPSKPKAEKTEKSTGGARGAKKHSDKEKQYSFIKGAKSYIVNKPVVSPDIEDEESGESDYEKRFKGIDEPTDYELRQMSRSGFEDEHENSIKAQETRKFWNRFAQKMRDAGILAGSNKILDREAYDNAKAQAQIELEDVLAKKKIKENSDEFLAEQKLKMQYTAGIITEEQYRKGKEVL